MQNFTPLVLKLSKEIEDMTYEHAKKMQNFKQPHMWINDFCYNPSLPLLERCKNIPNRDSLNLQFYPKKIFNENHSLLNDYFSKNILFIEWIFKICQIISLAYPLGPGLT